jgi:phosphohistidine swiveling domain-containing protein
MPGDDNENGVQLFPILRGESVGVSGEFSGYVVIAKMPEDLHKEWDAEQIAVLCDDLESFFAENPKEADQLLEKVSAVVSEFGEQIGLFSASAYETETIFLVKVKDAGHVLENGMHIRVVATESQGDVFFID